MRSHYRGGLLQTNDAESNVDNLSTHFEDRVSSSLSSDRMSSGLGWLKRISRYEASASCSLRLCFTEACPG